MPSDRIDTSWGNTAADRSCRNMTIPDAVPVNVGSWELAAACDWGMASPWPSVSTASGTNKPNGVSPWTAISPISNAAGDRDKGSENDQETSREPIDEAPRQVVPYHEPARPQHEQKSKL